jgi:hypothetical protein
LSVEDENLHPELITTVCPLRIVVEKYALKLLAAYSFSP